MDGWMGEWMDGWMGGWVDGWMDGWMYMYVCMYVWMDEWMNGCMYVWMDGWMGEWMDGWMDGCICMYVCMDGWMNEWMYVCMDGLMDGWMDGWMYYLFIYSSACSITVSNTTFYCNHTVLLLVSIYICLLEWFIFSKSIEFIYIMNCFKYLLVNSLLFIGQLPTLSTLVFRFSLSFFSLLHWITRWSTVCMLCLHGHSGIPIIFNLCKYDRICLWPVIVVVTWSLNALPAIFLHLETIL